MNRGLKFTALVGTVLLVISPISARKIKWKFSRELGIYFDPLAFTNLGNLSGLLTTIE